MARARVLEFLREAGFDTARSPHPSESLSALTDAALSEAGLDARECADIHRAFESRPVTTTAAAAVGAAGFAAWSVAHAGPLLEPAISGGVKVGKFVYDNLDALTAGWDTAVPVTAAFLTEFTLKLPSGTLKLGAELADLADNADRLATAVALKLDAGLSASDALDAVAMTADVVDVMEAAGTLGLSLVASWGAKKWIQKKYGAQIGEKKKRLDQLRARYDRVARLRLGLAAGLPSAAIAVQLQGVNRSQWGF